MRFVVYGAGGIGGVIGARLIQAGFDVTLIARGEHARTLRQKGLTLIAPEGTTRIPVQVALAPDEVKPLDVDSVVLMCMKSQHTEAALVDLAAVAPPDIHVACVQNGVNNERVAVRYFANVYATVVNLPATFLNPGEVVTHAHGHGGILDTGRYPGGVDERAREIVEAFKAAGFSARADGEVMRFKYAKLIANLANVFQALLVDEEQARDLLKAARREARAVFAAAEVACAGRDEVHSRRAGVYTMQDIPGHARTGGSSWQSLARGNADLETEYLNGEVCMLGRLHGVPTPVNDCCVQLAREAVRDKLGPGCLTSAVLRERLVS